MYRHDGSNSARARSARIRTEHDYEATQLESMRRRTSELGERAERVHWWRAAAASLARMARRPGTSRMRDDVTQEPAEATAGGR
jgi:hypothetical protein